MAKIKRLILTRNQLNEIMDNMKTNITFTGSTPTEMGTNAKQEYNDALRSGLKSSAIAFTGKSPRNNATDSTEANISISTNTPDIGKAVTDAVNNYVNNGGDINKVNVTGNAEDITNGTTDESKKFSKRQIEEARLKKIQEDFKFTKKQLKESFVDEYTYGTYLEKGLSPEEIKKRQMEDDWVKIEEKPYMYDKSMDDYYNYNVFDDAFIASGRKKSGRLDAFGDDARVKRFNGTKNSARKIKESFDTDEQLNEDEADWNQIKQMRMDNFWNTLEYYIGLKDEKGSLSPQQLADAEDICNKLSCFGADAEEFCNYAKEVLGLNSIYESYKSWDDTEDLTGGFDSEQFISHFREIEELYYDLPEDYELEDFYNGLLEEWGDFSDEERSSYKSFEQYCDNVISSYLYEKYSEKGMNKIQENEIKIKKKNKGKFNATKQRTGKSTEELTHSKNPLTRKRANFAKMAKRHWKPLKNHE